MFLSHFLVFERTKTWQNLCLSVSFANYADCFTLRFVFIVRLMILWYIYIFENKYIYNFDFNNLLKIPLMYFWDRITVQTMVVHNDPSSRHDNKHFLVLYWTCSSQIQALLLQEALLLWVGRLDFLQSVASTLKCFSLQHICPKWSLIAHWRMHDIKCLQTWNNHVLSLLEIVCSGICIYHHVEQKLKFFVTHLKVCPTFVSSCQLYKCERIYLFYWCICFYYCLLHGKLLAFPAL